MASWLRQQRHILERTLPLLCSAQSSLRPTAAGARDWEGHCKVMTNAHVRLLSSRGGLVKEAMHRGKVDVNRLFSTLVPPSEVSLQHHVDHKTLVDSDSSSSSDSNSSSSSSSTPLTIPILEFATGLPTSTTCQLDEDIFHVPVRVDILHRVVRWQLAKRQQGTHKTKTRSEVRGGGRKPWQQKGSGRARQGTIRAVQWRGGGVVHGPVVRSHAHSLQKKVRRLGLKCAVSAKVQEGRLLVVDTLNPEDCKTSTLQAYVDKLLADAPRRSALFVDAEQIAENLQMSSRNLPWVDVIPVQGLNVYSILQRDYLIMSRDAVSALVDRMRRPVRPTSPNSCLDNM